MKSTIPAAVVESLRAAEAQAKRAISSAEASDRREASTLSRGNSILKHPEAEGYRTGPQVRGSSSASFALTGRLAVSEHERENKAAMRRVD